MDLQEEDHIRPQVILTSSPLLSRCSRLLSAPDRSALLGSARPRRLHLDQVRDGSARALRAPVMLSAVKMEGHEAPDWSGFYSEEVGELSTQTRPEQKAQKVADDKVCEKVSDVTFKYKKANTQQRR